MKGQYGGSYPEYPDRKKEGGTSKKTVAILVVVGIIFIFVFYNFLRGTRYTPEVNDSGEDQEPPETEPSETEEPGTPPTKCGDNTCSSGEDCSSCPHDCSCGKKEYCSPEDNACKQPGFDLESLVREEYGTGEYEVVSRVTVEEKEGYRIYVDGEDVIITEDGESLSPPNL